MQLNKDLQTLANLLKQYSLVITTAESCTGGLLASYLTALSGSSQWFELGFITYSQESKINILEVSADILSRYGAVSQETVTEMCKGALSKSSAHIAISISGIAGPTGATPNYPVGSIWFAIASRQRTQTYSQHFSGSRKKVRQQTIHYAIQQSIEFILHNKNLTLS